MSSAPISSIFNDGYVAEAYERFRRDPSSIDESWRQFFRFAESIGGGTSGAYDAEALRKAASAAALIAATRAYGHLAVPLDPLGSPPPGSPELSPEFHGLTEADLRAIPASALGDDEGGSAFDLLERVRARYCGAIAYEFEHLGSDAEREWLRRTIREGEYTRPLTDAEKKWLLERLTQVDGLERFLGLAFVNAKRFSIEGLDAVVPMLDEAIVRAAHHGARRIVIGMAHRGRLNVLVNVMGKPAGVLFGEFEGHHDATNAADSTGDVKYHLGYRATREVEGVGAVEIRLEANPSHLEVVNPVATGVARAMERVDGGAPGERNEHQVLPVLIHGDAAFPGEGIVSETLNLMLLRGFRVGGTVHVIANNQVGFTTDPIDSRSTRYSSDLAKGFDIPVVHVSGDDAEACLAVIRLAIAWRERFAKDFVIDVVGFRRHGHNEADQPSFTQPKLYETIKHHPSPRETWAQRLVRERVVTEEDVKALDKAVQAGYQAAFDEMKKKYADAVDHHAPNSEPAPATKAVDTAVRAETLVSLNEQLLAFPSGFKLHPTLQRTLPRRREAINQKGIDWGHAEALAFASLVTEGVNIRLTGQDAERGTFSHRQAVLHDVNSGETYTPLGNLPQARAAFEVYNSPLSETAVMGFEYGYSIASPDTLTLWEAQFGDFANVAQPIVDQFLSADRAKWGQDSGLVLLLPHGYEGQGPEHSSARLERYLQLCAEGNMVVAYPSTPAQYFHILRRQARRDPRRPLVLMQPKSLLRLPAAASSLEDLATTGFKPVIDDPTVENRDAVKRLVFCTGKIYYDLIAAERAEGVAIVRVEELYPWPNEVAELVDRYPNVEEVVWAQEEPRNMGAWTYVQPRLRASVGTVTTLRYIGRPERASPAEGYNADHLVEQSRIVRDALAPLAVSGKRKAVKA